MSHPPIKVKQLNSECLGECMSCIKLEAYAARYHDKFFAIFSPLILAKLK